MTDAGRKPYLVKIIPAAQRDLDQLDSGILSRIHLALQELGSNPRPYGSIKLSADEGHRFRVGSYRIIYRMSDQERIIFIYRVKHRREVYR